MARNIKGNQDGERGENETYRIPGRGSQIPRKELVKEVEQGKHPGFSIYERDGQKYVRGNPDSTKKDNVNEPERYPQPGSISTLVRLSLIENVSCVSRFSRCEAWIDV